MARKAGLGQSQFHALFRATTGRSPKQFHLRKLLDRAVDRLVTTSDPIAEIAYGLGYQNVSSFNRLFRRRFGMTPSEFRARPPQSRLSPPELWLITGLPALSASRSISCVFRYRGGCGNEELELDFKALTFDCYGTLIDWETGLWNALQPLLSAGAARYRSRGSP